MIDLFSTLLPFRLIDVFDLAIVWLLVWVGITWLRATPARLALAGLATLVVLYLVALQLGLVLTTWILQGFAAVAVLIAIVVFQEDLRRLFERIASVWLRHRPESTAVDAVDTLVRALANLATRRFGALVVLPGRDSLERHVEGGVPLDARISEPLLLSLFDPHSPGHDGAVILQGDRATRFAVHLPLSTDRGQLGDRGTRHAAALGLSEQTDALCIVVSEERGSVAVARAGRLRELATPQVIVGEIRDFLQQLTPLHEHRVLGGRLFARWREAALALPVAALLWLLAVPGAGQVEVERDLPVVVGGVPAGYALQEVDPKQVRVRLAGRRRDVYLLDSSTLQVRVDAILVELGRRTFRISAENVQHPDTVEVRGIEPDTVKVSLRSLDSPKAGSTGAARGSALPPMGN